MKKRKNFKILLLSCLALFFIAPTILLAQGYVPLAPIEGLLPKGETVVLSQYISAAFRILIIVAGVLAVLVIMIGGVQYVTAGDSEERTKDAKNKISRAILGLILAIAAWLILYTINPNILSLELNIESPAANQTTSPPPPPKYIVKVYKNNYEQKTACEYDYGRGEPRMNFKTLEDCGNELTETLKNNPNARMEPSGNPYFWFNEKLNQPNPYCRAYACISTDDENVYELNVIFGEITEKQSCEGNWELISTLRKQYETPEDCRSSFDSEFSGPPRCLNFRCEEI